MHILVGSLWCSGVQLRGFDNLDAGVDLIQGKLRVPHDEVLIVTVDEAKMLSETSAAELK